MAEGRKYGMLKYGRYSFDHWPDWKPIPPEPPEEVWFPIPGSGDGWNPSITVPPVEIWTPVTAPVV